MNVCILRALSQGTMSDDEEYEFQYSDDEGGGGGGADEEDISVKVQNAYYSAKALVASSPADALTGYAEARAIAESRPDLAVSRTHIRRQRQIYAD